MTLVVDASMAAAWFLPDEQAQATDAVLEQLRTLPGHVPSLFWFEIRSLLLIAERRGRLRPGEALVSVGQLRALSLTEEGSGSDGLVMTLAAKHNLTGYDASYLALALLQKASLATLDRALAKAAQAEGLTVLGPHAQL
jgi:predicted nucleic acid-binding protein